MGVPGMATILYHTKGGNKMLARIKEGKAQFILDYNELYQLATELHYLESYANKTSPFLKIFADLLVEMKEEE